MKFLTETAMEFAEVILEKIQKILGGAIIFVNKFSKNVDRFHTCVSMVQRI